VARRGLRRPPPVVVRTPSPCRPTRPHRSMRHRSMRHRSMRHRSITAMRAMRRSMRRDRPALRATTCCSAALRCSSRTAAAEPCGPRRPCPRSRTRLRFTPTCSSSTCIRPPTARSCASTTTRSIARRTARARCTGSPSPSCARSTPAIDSRPTAERPSPTGEGHHRPDAGRGARGAPRRVVLHRDQTARARHRRRGAGGRRCERRREPRGGVDVVFEAPRWSERWVLEDGVTMPESSEHRLTCELLEDVLRAWVARTARDATVYANLALRWDEEHPDRRRRPGRVPGRAGAAGPEGAQPAHLGAGARAPRVAVEVVSRDTARKDYRKARRSTPRAARASCGSSTRSGRGRG
jgi:hypothetical protein